MRRLIFAVTAGGIWWIISLIVTFGRWILSIMLGLVWLIAACVNARWLWDKFRAQGKNSSPPAALVGAIFAVAALAACPWKNPTKWALLVPALLLDVGSGPIIALEIGLTLLDGLRGLNRRVARTSWIIKLGGGFLVWWMLAGGALSTHGISAMILVAVVVLYWPLLLAWYWRLRKHPPPEEKR